MPFRGGAQGNEPCTFVRCEQVKEIRKHSELNCGVYRPWKESSACCPGMRLGKANGTGWCHCPSQVACRSISWRRSCTWGGEVTWLWCDKTHCHLITLGGLGCSAPGPSAHAMALPFVFRPLTKPRLKDETKHCNLFLGWL